MFTGIIEATGIVKEVMIQGTNRTFIIESAISNQLHTDQSVSHNGVCLTIEQADATSHQVTAIEETIHKTNCGNWQKGTRINLERCMVMNGRIDGHIVQGHVDATATCKEIIEKAGSVEFTFAFDEKFAPLLIEKGSVCLNGISLTVFNVSRNTFTVAIIPYTFNNTNIQQLRSGDTVNIEFDVIGKYLLRHKELQVI